jgi:drug/metabolite transporter (DMT)-like permease
MWIIYSFLTALCETGKDYIGKSVSKHVDEYVMSFSLQLFAAIILLPIVIVTGIPEIKPIFWPLLAYGSLISLPAWSILYMKGLKLSPLSVSIPMLSFVPVFVTISTIIFEHIPPTLIGWIGIFLVTGGLYISRLNKETIRKNILSPILNIKNEPGALCMLGVSLIWGIGGSVSKFSVNASSPLFSSFSSCACSLPMLFIIMYFRSDRSRPVTTIKNEIKNNFKFLFSLGTLNGLSELFMRSGLSVGYTPFVSSIKRSNVIISSLIGKTVLHEEFGKAKTIGTILMFLGTVLMIIFK